MDKLVNFISGIKNSPEITAISETKLAKTMPLLYHIKICGYNLVHADSDQKAGGVGIYMKDNRIF